MTQVHRDDFGHQGGFAKPQQRREFLKPQESKQFSTDNAIYSWNDKDGKLRHFGPQDLKHKSRETTASIVETLIDVFIQNKDENELVSLFIQKMFEDDIYKGNRILMFMVEYCVHACLVDVFKNKDLMQAFIARVQVDINVRREELNCYSLRELASGETPRTVKSTQFDTLRNFCFTPEKMQKMMELIDKYDPTGKIVCGRDAFGGSLAQYQSASQASKIALRDWKRVPMSTADWVVYLESNGLKSVDEIDADFRSPITEEYLFGACMSTGNFTLLESAFKTSQKTPQQKKSLIEKHLSCFLDCIKGGKITKQNLSALTKLVISALPYHPLGCFDKKHFPLADKLNEMTNDQTLSQEANVLALHCLEDIKKTNVSTLCAKLTNDFVSKTMYYGFLGFEGLHKFCFESNNAEYIKQIALALSNISILRDLVIDNVKNNVVVGDAHSFIYNFYQELQTLLKSSQDERLQEELQQDIQKYTTCAGDAFLCFVSKFISGDSDVESYKSEFVKNSIAFAVSLCNKYSTTPIQTKAKTANDYAKKIENQNKKTIQSLSKDFEFFLVEAIQEISGTHHKQMSTIRSIFIEKLVRDFAFNLSFFEGESDEEFAYDVENELITGFIALLRKEANGYVMVINQKLFEDQTADIAKDKKELLHYFESRSHVLTFLEKKNFQFITKFNANLKKIQSNTRDEDGVFAFF